MDAGRHRPRVDRGGSRRAWSDRCRAACWSMRRARNGWSPAFAITAIALSALTYAAWPIFPAILAAAILHAAASCVLGPAIAAISLGLVGHAGIGERLGRNARFASIGNGLAAAADGRVRLFLLGARGIHRHRDAAGSDAACASRISRRAKSIPSGRTAAPEPRRGEQSPPSSASLLAQRSLLIFAGCIMLFHLANAAMLPLMGSVLTTRSSEWATVLIAACIVVPQRRRRLISPWVGRQAQILGPSAPAADGFCRAADPRDCCLRPSAIPT